MLYGKCLHLEYDICCGAAKLGKHRSKSYFSNIHISPRATADEGGEQNSRAAQQSSQGILRFYTDEAPGFQM